MADSVSRRRLYEQAKAGYATAKQRQTRLHPRDPRAPSFVRAAAYQLAQSVWADTGLLMCGDRRERARCDAGVLRLPKSHFFPGYPVGDAWNQDGELARKRDYFADST